MGFAILVLNTNQNQSPIPSKPKENEMRDQTEDGPQEEERDGKEEEKENTMGNIRGSGSPQEHGKYVFENLVVENQNLERILVVAHR